MDAHNANMRMKAPTNQLPTTEAPGCNIRRLREELGWSQKHLGDRAGCSYSTVSRIESNKELNMDRVAMCAAAMGATLEMVMLPPEIMAYARLSPERQHRIAEAIADAYQAQNSGQSPKLARPPVDPPVFIQKFRKPALMDQGNPSNSNESNTPQ
jgi:transcriptional regulator with XRE-family HTH domain